MGLPAGKDVYVEKSPSHSIWEGRKMTEAARKYRRIVQVGFQNRSGPYILKPVITFKAVSLARWCTYGFITF
jgi:predicted dehydrogenase